MRMVEWLFFADKARVIIKLLHDLNWLKSKMMKHIANVWLIKALLC